MPRPIDAEALYDALYDNEFQTFCPLDEVSGVIAAAPTLDYKPVRHGYWRFVQYDVNPQVGNWHCSVCNRISLIDAIGVAKYCPNCGAKMDGGKKDG